MAVTTANDLPGYAVDSDNIQVTIDAPSLDSPMTLPIVTMDQIEGTGRPETTTTQCGAAEAELTGRLPLAMTVRGKGHLEHAKALAQFWKTGAMVDVTSLIGSGRFFVTDFSLSEQSDENKLELGGGSKKRQINFQVQLKTESAVGNSG